MIQSIRFVALACAILLLAPACASNTKPETTVAAYGATVLGAATELQKGITASTDAKVLPVATAQKLTGYVEVVYAKSVLLGEALKGYHAATSVDLKTVHAAEVVKLIADINGTVSQILGTALPDGAVKTINALVGNVIAAVGLVQAEVSKGLGS